MIKLIQQLFRFGIIGIVCFLLDYIVMIILTERCGLNYLLSAGISFSISVIANYILSMQFVFVSKKDLKKTTEFTVFIFLSVIGLGINELLMWCAVEWLGLFYMFAKIIVTGIVMVYNFVSRKLLLDGGE